MVTGNPMEELGHEFSPAFWKHLSSSLKVTNIAPTNEPSQKETIVFHPSIFRCYLIFFCGWCSSPPTCIFFENRLTKYYMYGNCWEERVRPAGCIFVFLPSKHCCGVTSGSNRRCKSCCWTLCQAKMRSWEPSWVFFGDTVTTPLKTNMSPENQWLEDVFPTQIVPF